MADTILSQTSNDPTICDEKSKAGDTAAEFLERAGLLLICAAGGRSETAMLPGTLHLGTSLQEHALG